MADLKIGVVGTGGIGRTHIDRINTKLQGGVVIGCADVNVEFGKQVAASYGLKGYDSPEELILDDAIEAVMVTTSDSYHQLYVIESIQAGKPVFCEKPLAPTPEACKKIVEAEINSGKHFVQVGFMRRFDAGYVQLKELLDSGVYGAPLVVHCYHRNYDDGGVGFTTKMSVENSMIHEIDVLHWLLGENFVKTDVVFPRTSKHAAKDMKDPQIMHLITESGVYIDIESFIFSHYGYDVKCEIVCEEGTLSLPEPPYAMIRSNDARMTPICHDWSQRFPEAYNVEIQQWINNSKEGVVNGPTAWDGYVAQITAGCASKARDTQTMVDIEIPDMPDFYK